LTGNSADLRTILQREMRSSLRDSHKQPTTALLLSTIVTRTELTKKPTNLMGNLCCAGEHSVQFFVQFFLHR